MNTQTKNTYVYSSEEIKSVMTDAMKSAIQHVFSTSVNAKKNNKLYMKKRDFTDGVFAEYTYGQYPNSQLLSYVTEHVNIFSKFSKKNKKKVNKLLILMKHNPSSSNLLVKYLNFFSKKSDNLKLFSISNQVEDRIVSARKAYKDAIKYIKMDLEAHLKETREAYKAAKGNFYK